MIALLATTGLSVLAGALACFVAFGVREELGWAGDRRQALIGVLAGWPYILTLAGLSAAALLMRPGGWEGALVLGLGALCGALLPFLLAGPLLGVLAARGPTAPIADTQASDHRRDPPEALQ